MRKWTLGEMILRQADGVGGGTGAAPAAAAAAAPADASVLFPDDKPTDPPAGDAKPGDGAPATEWKEYQDDPAKSADENAAAKAEHDKTKPAADDDAGKVPADGKYALKMPDGVELDAELADAFGPEFVEPNLTNAQAQKLVDKYIGIQEARMAKQGETFAKTTAGWVDQAKKDAEIGGDKWNASVQAAQRAVNRLGTPALKEYLNASGGGNHPELIRFMAKAGAMISEDNPATGGAEGKGKPADPAHVLFPNDAPPKG